MNWLFRIPVSCEWIQLNGDGFGLTKYTNRLNLLYGEKARFENKAN